jgi:hypothetical protein
MMGKKNSMDSIDVTNVIPPQSFIERKYDLDDVIDLKVSDSCLDAYPCIHHVIVTAMDEDERIITFDFTMNGFEVYTILRHLQKSTGEHFEHYKYYKTPSNSMPRL